MRYLILSDIHGNLEGLEAVLADADGQYDEILNCGDAVGYGPDPNAVVAFCRDRCAVSIRGNHDKASAGIGDPEWFNPVAQASIMWTTEKLTQQNLDWVRALPSGPVCVGGFFDLVHGSPADEDEYILDGESAMAAASCATSNLTFFGHTHIQGGWEIVRQSLRPVRNDRFSVERDLGYLVNPGSVGQPRDGDARAGYALYDPEERQVEYRRVSYDVQKTHRKILEAGLPEVLGLRLYRGR